MHFLPRIAPVTAAALTFFVTACDAEPAADAAAGEPAPATTTPETAPLVAYEPGGSACDEDGALRGRLYGAIDADLDWRANGMSCEGMARPRGEGARLRFAGAAGDEGLALAIIISMPSLEPGTAMQSVPSNVTVIEEGRGRFFSATDLETCWTDVGAQSGLGDTDYRVEGVLYCIAPIVEIGGEASITLDEIEFVGRLAWESG